MVVSEKVDNSKLYIDNENNNISINDTAMFPHYPSQKINTKCHKKNVIILF